MRHDLLGEQVEAALDDFHVDARWRQHHRVQLDGDLGDALFQMINGLLWRKHVYEFGGPELIGVIEVWPGTCVCALEPSRV